MSYDPGAPGDRSQPPGGYGAPGGPPPYGSGYGQQPPPGWGAPQGPPPGMPGGYGGGGGQYPPQQSKTFFSGLLDVKFTSFFTSVMLPVVYILGLAYLVISMITAVYYAFRVDASDGILALVFGLIEVAFFAGLLKVGLELVKAVVDGAENRR
jgi:uncharacterized protein DUF4282